MYLHIGNDITVRTKDIIAILDGKYVDKMRPTITEALPDGKKIRSSVLTDTAVYYSAINSLTLQNRALWQNMLAISDG